MINPPDPADHLPLTVPVYQILLSLAGCSQHGYAIIQDIAARTDGEVRLTASTLYAAMRRLLESGVVDEISPSTSGVDTRRRYYQLTSYGRQVAVLEARRLERAAEMARAQSLLPKVKGS